LATNWNLDISKQDILKTIMPVMPHLEEMLGWSKRWRRAIFWNTAKSIILGGGTLPWPFAKCTNLIIPWKKIQQVLNKQENRATSNLLQNHYMIAPLTQLSLLEEFT